MRFGYWAPVFGGWLRNVPDEGMDASWAYMSRLVRHSPEIIGEKIADMRARRERAGGPPMQFGMAAYAIVRDSEAEAQREVERITDMGGNPPPGFDNFEQWLSGTELEREMKIQEYSVTNRGLRPRLIGTPEQLREKIAAYEAAGLDLLLLQFSPQYEEMERFSAQVIRPTGLSAAA